MVPEGRDAGIRIVVLEPITGGRPDHRSIWPNEAANVVVVFRRFKPLLDAAIKMLEVVAQVGVLEWGVVCYGKTFS